MAGRPLRRKREEEARIKRAAELAEQEKAKLALLSALDEAEAGGGDNAGEKWLQNIEVLNEVNKLIRLKSAGGRIAAANMVREWVGGEADFTSASEAWVYLNQFWRNLLEGEMYLEAGVMNWGKNKFQAEPYFMRKIFGHLPRYDKTCIMAAASACKTYGIVCWLYLDYQRDPEYTAIKCLAVNEAQLKRNIFTHLYEMHDASVMEVAGKSRSALFLGDDSSNMDSGFEGITAPQSGESSGRVKGIKPKIREKEHPVFGMSTRVRIFVDEFQNVHDGLEKDFASPMGSSDGGPYKVKLIVSGNPEDVTHIFGKISEPVDGWSSFSLEEDEEWVSKVPYKYQVLRLDGLKCENVVQKREVFPNIITWKAFSEQLEKGDTHPEYITFARGAFPLGAARGVVITRNMAERAVGEALFHEGSERWAAVDIALRHDKVRMAFGRFGLATGMRNADGTTKLFTTRSGDRHGLRFAMQLDGFKKIDNFFGSALELAKSIAADCRALGVKPRFVAVDQTGAGEGVYSWLRQYYGEVLGIQWNAGATEMKILVEDASTPKEKYAQLVDEMWYATGEWFAYGAMFIGPKVEQYPFLDQLTGRRIGASRGGRRAVETKDAYKLRNHGVSPDEADSFVMGQQLIRVRGGGLLPTMTGEVVMPVKKAKPKGRNVDRIDNLSVPKGSEWGRNGRSEFNIENLRKTHVIGETPR